MIGVTTWVARATHFLFQEPTRFLTVEFHAEVQLDTDLTIYDHTTLSNIKGFTGL